MALQLKIVIGSTREGRAADLVAPWVVDRAQVHGDFDVDVLDLRDWPLPIFQETFATLGDPADPTYSDPIVRAWNAKIKEGDAYLFITPEYNHSIPGVLKNALDNVYFSYAFRNKPALAVGYSSGVIAAARAVEHLAAIAIEVELVPLKNAVLISNARSAFDGVNPNDSTYDARLQIALEDLAWWGGLLKQGRAAGELPVMGVRWAALTAAR